MKSLTNKREEIIAPEGVEMYFKPTVSALIATDQSASGTQERTVGPTGLRGVCAWRVR